MLQIFNDKPNAKLMQISDIIPILKTKQHAGDIMLRTAATLKQLQRFEKTLLIEVPEDVKTFYLFCNGFDTYDWLFRIIPLDDILQNYRDTYRNSFYIAEYMIYTDMWSVEVNPADKNDYIIFNQVDKYRVLTNSFAEFLQRVLTAGIFEEGGLYSWNEEIDKKSGIL